VSEFRATAHAQVSPTWCFLCREYEGPFLDTHIEHPAIGHVYICAPTDIRPGCLGQMAQLFGMLTAAQADLLSTENAELKVKVEELEQRRTVQISYEDLIKALAMTPRARAASVKGA